MQHKRRNQKTSNNSLSLAPQQKSPILLSLEEKEESGQKCIFCPVLGVIRAWNRLSKSVDIETRVY